MFYLMTHVSLRNRGVTEGDKIGWYPMTPPELSRDAPVTRVLQPSVPRNLMNLGNETKFTITYSLE